MYNIYKQRANIQGFRKGMSLIENIIFLGISLRLHYTPSSHSKV